MGTWKDLTNQQFGSLIVERYLGNSKWQCRCMKCENEIIAMTNTLHNLNKLGREGCKHVRAIKPGDRYGSLTVVSAANDYIKPKTGAHEKQWLCKCQCGRDKIVLESNLKSFKTTSCGKCSHKISIPEKSIVFYLSKYFEDIQENYHTDFLGKKEIDIYIPSLKIGIEYDGAKWHKSVEKDLEKNRICKENGISLVRIREPKCISSEMFDHVIITPDTF